MLIVRVLAVCAAMAGLSLAQISQLACAGTAAQAVIRSEGLAERVGDIVLECQSNIPGGQVVSAVQVVLSAPVVASPAAELTFERGGAVAQTLQGQVTGDSIITFPSLNALLDGTGRATIRISNIRVNATGREGQQITAYIGTTGTTGLGVVPNPVTPAIVQPGLLVNSTVTSIFCVGSPTPNLEPLTLAGLFSAGTAFSTLRATEGSADAFQVRLGGAATGTRILVQLSGFPAGARVYLPETIAGSSATQPTSAGDLGLTRSGGRYTPGPTGSLLLSQVVGANANGVGGNPVYRPDAPGSGTVVLLGAREVPLNDGAGVAVFEVMDSNSTVFESAQIPVFVSLPGNSGGQGTIAQARLKLGPISTAATEVPRFAAEQEPGLDCTVLHDCDANYFPHLEVEAPALIFSAELGSTTPLSKRIIVRNGQGGLMPWRVSWVYENGRDWLNVVTPTGVNQAAFQLDARVNKITEPGVYRATLIIDAGALAGTVQLPVTFEVGGVSNGLPAITEAFNSAGSTVTTLTPGSRAVLRGVRFPGTPQVTFNGIAATVIAAGPERIEVVVPETLGPAASAKVVVGAQQLVSPEFTVTLAMAAPVVYPGAVFNQDNSANAASGQETPGRVLQVFVTGLPSAANGRVTAKIRGGTETVSVIDIPYAGAAPGYAGVQQVNLRIPDRVPTGQRELLICGVPNNTGTEVCSAPVRVFIAAP